VPALAKLLVAIDNARSAQRLLALALPMAKALGAELVLLHVWDIPGFFVDGLEPWALERLLAPVRERASAMLERELGHVRTKVPMARSLLRYGNAAIEIERVIAEEKPGLVVLGTHGPAGGIAAKLLRSANVPVLAVPVPLEVKPVEAART